MICCCCSCFLRPYPNMGLLLGLRLSLEIKQSSKCLPSNLQLFHNIIHRQMSQTEPISILFLTLPKVAQAMWWVAQAMWWIFVRIMLNSAQLSLSWSLCHVALILRAPGRSLHGAFYIEGQSLHCAF